MSLSIPTNSSIWIEESAMPERKEIRWMEKLAHFRPALSRREFLQRAGAGFGNLALTFLLAQEAEATGAKGKLNPLAPKQPMFPAKAKSVIFLFMYGGPS